MRVSSFSAESSCGAAFPASDRWVRRSADIEIGEKCHCDETEVNPRAAMRRCGYVSVAAFNPRLRGFRVCGIGEVTGSLWRADG